MKLWILVRVGFGLYRWFSMALVCMVEGEEVMGGSWGFVKLIIYCDVIS